MKSLRPWDIVRALGAIFTLWWLWILIQGGMELLPSILILILPGVGISSYEAWSRRAASKRAEAVADAHQVAFDPDAAIQKYLATRNQSNT